MQFKTIHIPWSKPLLSLRERMARTKYEMQLYTTKKTSTFPDWMGIALKEV